MMMSKSHTNELKFSIQNLIDTKSKSSESTRTKNQSLKCLMINNNQPSTAHPIPMIKPKVPHRCWSFFSQLTNNKNLNHNNLPFNSSLIFLNKMNQVWEHFQRTQISPSMTTTTTTTTENYDGSDEEINMETSSSSIRQHRNDDDEDDDESIDDDEDDEVEEGECSTSTGEKHHTRSNSDENDKLKNYPCTQCGKVGLIKTIRFHGF